MVKKVILMIWFMYVNWLVIVLFLIDLFMFILPLMQPKKFSILAPAMQTLLMNCWNQAATKILQNSLVKWSCHTDKLISHSSSDTLFFFFCACSKTISWPSIPIFSPRAVCVMSLTHLMIGCLCVTFAPLSREMIGCFWARAYSSCAFIKMYLSELSNFLSNQCSYCCWWSVYSWYVSLSFYRPGPV